MGCRGVAVLPEGMSQERFDWLARWVADPADIIRTPGSESNVKEIYDRCAELDRDPVNVIFNQFSEFGNYLVHYLATGRALGRIVESMQEREPDLRVHAFVSATGSAGTIGAGDAIKERFGARIVAVEALECPTMLENGFGEHNIQGIGDKHIPLIHNVMNTDTVVGISRPGDRRAQRPVQHDRRPRVPRRRGAGCRRAIVEALDSFGLSSICNVLAAIAVARHDRLGPDDVIVTVATDGAAMYRTERDKVLARDFADGFDEVTAAEVFGRHVLGGGRGRRLLDLTPADRRRIFNLGYFTWVEQQGIEFDRFVERREPAFWEELRAILPVWDGLIDGVQRAHPSGGAGMSRASGLPRGGRARARQRRSADHVRLRRMRLPGPDDRSGPAALSARRRRRRHRPRARPRPRRRPADVPDRHRAEPVRPLPDPVPRLSPRARPRLDRRRTTWPSSSGSTRRSPRSTGPASGSRRSRATRP